MMNLHRYCQNPFASPSFGVSKLLAFTTDHLAKVEANNPGGIYDGRIAATTVALQAVNAAAVDDEERLGSRKAAKTEKRRFRKALPGSIGKIYLALAAKYGLRAPVLREFFPAGRSVFVKCRDAILDDEFGVLITALKAHQSELGPESLASAKDLQSGWQALQEASGSSAGAKAHTEKMRRDARAALQHELFLNLLMLAQNFPGQPQKLSQFMQQSLLKRHSKASKQQPVAKSI